MSIEAMSPERIEGLHQLSADLSEYRRSMRQADGYLIGAAIEGIDDSINEIVRQNREIERLRGLFECLDRIDDPCSKQGEIAGIIREALEASAVPE